jgi:hypothetical protein
MRTRPTNQEWQQLVYGEVYVPYRLDTDGEFMRPAEIEKAAHFFLQHSKPSNIDEQHNFKQGDGDTVVETYLAKENDPDGFVPGSWIAVTLVNDPERWQKVLDGTLNGYSMAGSAQKVIHKEVKITALKEARGETELSTNTTFKPHTHTFTIKFDDNGNVVPMNTATVEGHNHEVMMTTATQPNEGHAHRFNVNWDATDETVTKEERTIQATELVNVQPTFLSLVSHGAARRAFTVIKSQKQNVKEELMDRVVHAVVLEEIELNDASLLPELEWLGSAAIKVKERVRVGKSNKYVLMPATNFTKGSIEVQGTSDDRIKLLVGVLKTEDMTNAVIITEEKTKMDEKQVLEIVEKAVSEKITPLIGSFDELKKSITDLVAKQAVVVEPPVPPAEPKAPEKPAETVKADPLAEVMAKLQELTGSITSMKEDQVALAKKTDSLVEKTDAIAQTASTVAGVKTPDTVEKSEPTEPKSPWGGFFTNTNNPKVAAILNS